MTVLNELVRRLRQHHNDIDALYLLQQATDAKVSRIDTKVIAIDTKVNGLDAKVNGLAGVQRKHSIRLRHIEDTQREHGEILNSHTEKLDNHDKKHDSHTEKLDQILELLRTN